MPDEDMEKSLLNESSDGDLTVYSLPGGNIAILDTFSSRTTAMFVHVRDTQCPLEICSKKTKSKKHTLVLKGVPICPHSLLIHFLPPTKEVEDKPKKNPQHKIDYRLTVRSIMGKIKSDFPQSFQSLMDGEFLKKSRVFVDTLLKSPEKLSEVLNTLPSDCEFCGTELDDWNFKEPKSFLLTLGHIKEIKINVKVCKSCRRSFYPDFYKYGILFIHNKFMLCIEALLDILNSLKNDGSLIETIKGKLKLLGQLEGLSADSIDLTRAYSRI